MPGEAIAPKRKRQPELTKQRILDSAKAEFSEKGLKGARTAAIARRAGTNSQAIFHYFGSKETLYTAVIISLFEHNWFLDLRDHLLSLDPLDAVGEIMDHMMDRAQREPTFISILLDANMHMAKHLQDIGAIRDYYENVLETIGAVLRKGRALGKFEPIEPEFFYIMLMGALGSPTNARHLFSVTLQRDYRAAEELDRWYRAFKLLVIRGISSEPAG